MRYGDRNSRKHSLRSSTAIKENLDCLHVDESRVKSWRRRHYAYLTDNTSSGLSNVPETGERTIGSIGLNEQFM